LLLGLILNRTGSGPDLELALVFGQLPSLPRHWPGVRGINRIAAISPSLQAGMVAIVLPNMSFQRAGEPAGSDSSTATSSQPTPSGLPASEHVQDPPLTRPDLPARPKSILASSRDSSVDTSRRPRPSFKLSDLPLPTQALSSSVSGDLAASTARAGAELASVQINPTPKEDGVSSFSRRRPTPYPGDKKEYIEESDLEEPAENGSADADGEGDEPAADRAAPEDDDDDAHERDNA
jgi:hypothetical protein